VVAPQYNSEVAGNQLYLLTAALLLAGCNRAPESKEAIRTAVMDHLAKNSGLDVNSMTIDVGDVKFTGTQAVAAVSFRPKSSPDQGMTMNYTLDRRGNTWVVAKRADSGGHGGPGATPSPQSGGDLPPGHPPVGKPDAAKK
jgi:hypothetical protein